MRVLYVGNFTEPWRTEPHVASALEEWGHHVIRHQLSPGGLRKLPQVTRAQRPDFVLWTNTSSLAGPPQLARNTMQLVKAQNIPVVSYHLDRYFDLARESCITTEPWFTLSDICMTADGGNDERFAALGVNHVWMPPAVHGPDTEYIGVPRDEFRARVAFVGSWENYHSEWPWRLEMIRLLRERYGSDFRTFPDHPSRPIRGHDLNDLYASVDVVVGDSCFAGTPQGRRYHSDRPYETMGRGGCLAFPRVEGFEESFTDGIHLRYFDAQDPSSMFRVIDELLADPEQRELLRKRGREEVMTNHLYRHRVSEIVQRTVEHRYQILGWTGDVRPGTYDATTIREVWLDDVYHVRDSLSPGDLVIDCGGNVGAFSIFVAKQGAQVIAFEPFPDNIAQFEKNMALTGTGKGDIAIMPFGVAEYDGIARFSFFDTDRSQSCFRTEDGELELNVMSLAKFIAELDRDIAFLKVDIEGSEVYALQNVDFSRIARIAVETHQCPGGTTHARVKEMLKPHFRMKETGGHLEGYIWGRNKHR